MMVPTVSCVKRISPVGLVLLKGLMEQYKLFYSYLKNKIGSKSLVSHILCGRRSLTISHINALSSPFNLKPALFL
ncbi:TPA: hypothetical protein ACU6JA_005157 [Salmonella enterica]